MTPKTLLKLAQAGKCVVWLSGRHMPATFLASMQFRFVMNHLPSIKQHRTKKK